MQGRRVARNWWDRGPVMGDTTHSVWSGDLAGFARGQDAGQFRLSPVSESPGGCCKAPSLLPITVTDSHTTDGLKLYWVFLPERILSRSPCLSQFRETVRTTKSKLFPERQSLGGPPSTASTGHVYQPKCGTLAILPFWCIIASWFSLSKWKGILFYLVI